MHANSAAWDVPWKTVKGRLLEELLFELLGAMGGVDLTWRTGGTGDGAADGGRDIEVSFLHPTPDGDVEREKWWVEVKGRSKSVEPIAVKSAVLNAAGNDDVDVLVIASNSDYTNPTRDWVKEWQRTHRRPRVRLWDQNILEKLVRENPVISARVIPEVIQGKERLALLVERFESVGRVPLEEDVAYFWENKQWVTEAREVACLTYAEVVLGDLTERPWAAILDDSRAVDVAVQALVGLPMAMLRTKVLADAKATATSAYLLQWALPRLPADFVSKLLINPFEYLDGDWEKFSQASDGWRQHFLRPMWGYLKNELLDACSSDCVRVSVDPGMILKDDPRGPRYWRRFNPALPAPDGRSLIIEDRNRPCAVGFDLTNRSCPLFEREEEESAEVEIREIEMVAQTISYRRDRPDGRFSELYSSSDPLKRRVDRMISEITESPEEYL
ncbi:restriction endonuclease [Streptomyces sp. NPDC000229]|uniref:restriction endonuclease n=1 Tax=Streptomyces sp. NPDC000229 TaxID=3154247 RepID=UPI00332F76BD